MLRGPACGRGAPLVDPCFEEAALFCLRALTLGNAYRNVLSPPWLVANGNKTAPTYRVLRVINSSWACGQPSGGVGDPGAWQAAPLLGPFCAHKDTHQNIGRGQNPCFFSLILLLVVL